MTEPRDAEAIAALVGRLKAIAECATPDVPDADFQRRARYDLQEIARAAIPLAESLAGKIEAVERERDDALETVDSVQWDCRNALIRAEAAESKLAAAEAENALLRDALAPFAACCDAVEAYIEDVLRNGGSPLMPLDGLRLSDFRRASVALTPAPATPPEPNDHEAEGAMLYRGKHEARTAALSPTATTSGETDWRRG